MLMYVPIEYGFLPYYVFVLTSKAIYKSEHGNDPSDFPHIVHNITKCRISQQKTVLHDEGHKALWVK